MKCKDCRHFIGYGDWDLCCRLKHELCYEDTDICDQFMMKAVVGNLHTDYYTKQTKIEGIRVVAYSKERKVTRPHLIEAIKFLLNCLEEQNGH